MKYFPLCLLFASLSSFASNQADCLRLQTNEVLKANVSDSSMGQWTIRINVKNESNSDVEANLGQIQVTAGLQGQNCEVVSTKDIVAAAKKQHGRSPIPEQSESGTVTSSAKLYSQNCDGAIEDKKIAKQINKCLHNQCQSLSLTLSIGERVQDDPRDVMSAMIQDANIFDDHAFHEVKYPLKRLGKLCQAYVIMKK